MNENLEIEYKMLVSEQEFNQLRDLTGVDQVLVQSNVYYDCTPSSTLKHIAMRIRDVQGKHWFNEDSSGRGRAGNGDGAAGKQSGSVG